MYSFKAKIYKVGINPCVDVPEKIYSKLIATKGYIPVKGTINQFPFQQTLCPVKKWSVQVVRQHPNDERS